MGAVKRTWPSALLWLIGLALGWVTLDNWIQLNDEGLMLQAAARISHGEVPYRDFWWFYPPGQPYLLAAIWKLHGPSLVDWRIVRALSDATVALLVWRLALRRAGRAESLLAWAVAIFAVSSATGPHPYPIAMALALGSLLLLERRPALAGLLLGVAAAWRIEFAGYLAIGSLAGLIVKGRWRRTVPRWSASALLAVVALYGPVVTVAGIGRSWDLLVRYPVLEFGKYQNLPFPLVWDGGGNARGLDLAAQFLSYHMPLALIFALVASLTVLMLIPREGRWLELAAGVFGIGMANYLLVRADAFHTGPLAVMDAVLGAWAIGAVREARQVRGRSFSPPRRRRIVLACAAAAVAFAGLSWSLADTAWKREREVSEARLAVPIGLPVADGVRELAVTRCSLRGEPLQLCSLADLVASVRWVRSNTTGPIYVATKRADLVTAGAPLFYVLAGRANVTRYDIAAPGVLNSPPVELEIIDALKVSGAPVVRYSAGITAAREPNQAGKSSGFRMLDDWLADNYVVVARFGVWTVLEPASSRGAAEAK